jgi:hypothetical protein
MLEILIVVVLTGIATYDTIQSRRKNSRQAQEETQIFDIAG